MKRNTRREHGLEQMNRMESIIAVEPMSAEQLADAMGFTRSNIIIYLRRLRDAGRAYIFDHAPAPEHGGRPRPIFAAGNLPDDVYEAKRKPKPEQGRVVKAKTAILAALAEPMTARQLGEVVHLSRSRVLKYLKALREGDTKQVYIAAWSGTVSTIDMAPMYKAGSLPDKKRPHRTLADRYRKERADPVQHALALASRRARSRANTAAASPKQVTWFSALGAV